MFVPLMATALGYLVLVILLALSSILFLVLFLTKKPGYQAQEKPFDALLGFMPEGYLGLDAQGTILEVNETYLAMTGYKRTDLVGKPLQAFLPMEGKELIISQLKTIEIKKSRQLETAHLCKDGSYLPLEVSVTALALKNLAFICFYRDLTERKKAESAQLHATELLRYVIEHTRSSIAIHDTNLRYLYVSQKYLDEYHLNEIGSIIGRHHYEVLPDMPQKWRDVHKRALAGEVVSAEDDQYIRFDGKVEYTRWECRPWYTEEKKIGGIIIYTEMITKQKHIEEELRKSKNYLEALLTHANAPMVVWDPGFVITIANQAFASLFGEPVDQILGRRLKDFAAHIPSHDREDLFKQLEENQAISSAELIMQQKDGTFATYLWNASPIFKGDSGELVATLAQGQDITQRKQVEQQNSEQLEELKRWYSVMTDREDRIIELKREVNELSKQAGQGCRYSSVGEDLHA